MDPDMVRQQGQAESEALKSISKTLPGSRGKRKAAATGTVPGGTTGHFAGGTHPKVLSSIAALLCRFITFPLAAAALASSLSLAVQFMRWQASFAEFAFFGTTGLFSMLWSPARPPQCAS